MNRELALIAVCDLDREDGAQAAVIASEVVASRSDASGAALVAEVGVRRARRPTVLCTAPARELEAWCTEQALGAAARGALTFVSLDGPDAIGSLGELIEAGPPAAAVVASVRADLWPELLERSDAIDAAVVCARMPERRAVCGLAAREARAAGLPVKVITRGPGRIAARRALAGLAASGPPAERARRIVERLASSRGQAAPLVLGAITLLLAATMVLFAVGGAASAEGRLQRAADLAAVSAARSMRDDFDRLFVPARLPDGRLNPEHLGVSEYLERAAEAATVAARRNGADPGALEVRFPDGDSFAPLRARVRIEGGLPAVAGERASPPGELVLVVAVAEAEVVVASATGTAPATVASGGGYSGVLAYRQGKPMRPDVADAFDRLSAAAIADGVALAINSAFRSDAEQAVLWAQHPDPRWVAPPGTSLHRCATELDIGPPAAYGWLAANAPGLGFIMRYPWEPWHWGYGRGPAPCSREGDLVGSAGGGDRGGSDGRSSGGSGLPGFVPVAYREAIAAAAARWSVSAALLAAQLMAESNFNPYAVSPAGAQGIAQFIPSTAAAYGLDDPFDAAAAIDAQAHLMSDLLGQFGGAVELALAGYNAGPAAVAACGCVPPYPETQAYVARIVGLMGGGFGAGALAAPALEVRLVS